MIGPGYASAYKFEKGKHEAGKCFFSITCNVHSLIKTKLLLCCWILQNSVPKRAAHALFILQITNKPTCILPVTNLASFKIRNSGHDLRRPPRSPYSRTRVISGISSWSHAISAWHHARVIRPRSTRWSFCSPPRVVARRRPPQLPRRPQLPLPLRRGRTSSSSCSGSPLPSLRPPINHDVHPPPSLLHHA
jgi:hypothetical protein